MRVAQEKVRAFHEKYGYPTGEVVRVLPDEEARFRKMLIDEELGEYVQANAAGDIVGVADGLADLLYVILGTCVFHGIDIQPIFDEVHRSNMTKDIDRDGLNKPVKGPTFERARVAEVLFMQRVNIGEMAG